MSRGPGTRHAPVAHLRAREGPCDDGARAYERRDIEADRPIGSLRARSAPCRFGHRAMIRAARGGHGGRRRFRQGPRRIRPPRRRRWAHRRRPRPEEHRTDERTGPRAPSAALRLLPRLRPVRLPARGRCGRTRRAPSAAVPRSPVAGRRLPRPRHPGRVDRHGAERHRTASRRTWCSVPRSSRRSARRSRPPSRSRAPRASARSARPGRARSSAHWRSAGCPRCPSRRAARAR